MSRRQRGRSFDSETELASAAVAQFKLQGYTVYPELHGIDFVLTIPDPTVQEGKRIIAVEAKLSYNIKVLEQAWQHRRIAHEVAICIPRSSWGWSTAKEMLELLDIGVFTVHRGYNYNPYATPETPRTYVLKQEVIAEGKHYLESPTLLGSMIPEAETWTEPGRPSPRSFTPWRVQEITYAKYIAANPGVTVGDLLKAHHDYGINMRTKKPKVIPQQAIDRLLALCHSKVIKTFIIGPDQFMAGRNTRLYPPPLET